MDDHEYALPLGTLLAGEYRIDGVLGAGGFGITYRARDVKLDIDVAIKEYFPRDFASRANTVTVRPRSKGEVEQFQWGLSQFIEEARRLARLQHPNIVRCMRYFEANDTGYFVMTFEQGKTLDKYFPKPPQQGELDRLLVPLLDALEALHAAGIYHRDISPDNILVRDDDTPVLIDFGASRQAMARRTQTMAAIVKPGYSPIEQYERETRQQGAWSDIYALGATLYDVIAGGPPPDALSRVRSDAYVSAREAARGAYRGDFLDAIDWALEPDPDRRPVTIREWRRKLLPNPSGRRETGATRAEADGGAKTAVTRFFGKGEAKAPAAKAKASSLRWPDYVLRGAALVMLAVFLVRMFGADKPQEAAAPQPVAGDAEEQRLAALSANPEAAWKRVELVLRRLGYLKGAGPATLSDIRASLKGYQSATGFAQTGTLNQQLLNRILEEPVELDPYAVPSAVAYGAWLYEQNQEFCRITSGATRIEGRTVATQRPFLRMRSNRGDNDGSMDVAFTTPDLFDVSSPISISAGGTHHLMHYDGKDIILGMTADGYAARDVPRMLRHHKGEVTLHGTSAYGGALKLTFSTDGFEPAFRAMAAECSPEILYWIEDWGAVAKDANAVVWHAVGHGSEDEAKKAAMDRCTSRSEAGGCEDYASFKEQCWALTTGQRKKDDWASGWGADATLDSAKSLALQACADDGGHDCEFVMHICSDGSEEWHASAQ